MDEEEETVLMMWNYLQLLDSNIRNREMWVHPINKKRDISGFIGELRADPAKFFNYCRMSVSTFDYILDEIRNKIEKRNTNWRKSITGEERLFITLR